MRAVSVLIGIALLLIASIVVSAWSSGELTFAQAWFSLLLSAFSAICLILRRNDLPAQTAALLLATLAVPFSGINPPEIQRLGPTAGPVLEFLWTAFLLLFPFAFLHFSFTFPLAGSWIERRPARQLWIYLPFLALLALNLLEVAEADAMSLLAYPLGFLTGLGVLLRRYRFSLTASERNRLRVILIGCLAGALPRLLAFLGSPQIPIVLQEGADVLLTIFPAALLIAVLKENFSDVSPAFRRLLILSLAGTGVVNVFYLTHLAATLFVEEGSPGSPAAFALSSSIALLACYPLLRWGGSFVTSRFEGPQYELDDSPEPAGDFQPIQPNPYVVGNPIRSAGMFFGRSEELQFIGRKLNNEREGCVIVLCGERRAGKTSILYQILNGRLGQDPLPAFIDLQGVVAADDGEFLQALSQSVDRAARRRGIELDPQALSRAKSYTGFAAYLEEYFKDPERPRLALLVDEYELIDSRIEQGSLSGEIRTYISGLLERFPRLHFVFTGSQPMQPHSPWKALLSRSAYREVSFLARPDAEALVRTPLRGKVVFQAGIAGQIWRLCRGHPFFTQLICQTLVDVLNEKGNRHADRRSLEETVNRVLENPPPQLLYQWANFSSDEKLALSALATLLRGPRAFAPPQRSERLFRSLPRDVSQSLDGTRIRMLFESLREDSVLERDQTRYRFRMDLLRLWVRSERNIWNVLNEVRPPASRASDAGPASHRPGA